jgi:hypothetical protein
MEGPNKTGFSWNPIIRLYNPKRNYNQYHTSRKLGHLPTTCLPMQPQKHSIFFPQTVLAIASSSRENDDSKIVLKLGCKFQFYFVECKIIRSQAITS